MSQAGPYIVMERLHGETLRARLDRGPLPPTEASRIISEVARGVAHAHSSGVVHRDLKPANVFLRRDGGVKVLDFGLAGIRGGDATIAGGTPDYMAPEQEAGGPGDARGDVYSLGVMLDEMLGPVQSTGPLSDVAARARAPDAAARFRDGQEMLTALQAASGSALRRARRGKLVLLAGLVVAAVATAWLFHRGADGTERVGVAVADVENATGDPEMDGLAGLIATSLDQSPHLAVVPRTRLLDGLGASGDGGEPVRRIDASAGREAARRAGARVLLVPSVRAVDGALALEIRALAPETGAPLFTVKERAGGKAEVAPALDRLARATRLALRERDADVRGSDIRLADAVTNSLLAYQHYAASQQCMYRTSFGQDCAEPLEKALAADPTFALAHYQLAVWRAHHGGSRAEQKASTDAASRHIARVPPKERLLIRAWVAHFDGRDEEALAHLAELTRSNPEDEEGIYEAGDLLYHRSEFDLAVPWFARQLQLDPALAHGWGLEHLAHSLGALGRQDHLQRLAEGWARGPANSVNLHALATALAWLGDLPGAATAARRESEAGGGLSALEDQAYVAIMGGRYDDVREALGQLARPGSPAPGFGYLALAALDAYQGRRASGAQTLEAMAKDLGPAGQDAMARSMRIQYLAGDGDSKALRDEVEGLRALDPEAAAVHAPLLAWLGDLEGASRLASHLRPGSPRQRTYEAVLIWQRGEKEEGLRRLREIAQGSPYDVDFGLAPAWLVADLSWRGGADAEAVEAFRRFRRLYIPTTMWRSWAHPRGLVLEAGALARLGRDDEARAALARFRDEWSDADRDEPLLAQASEIAAQLDAPGSRVPGRN